MTKAINQQKLNELKEMMGDVFATLIDTFIDDTEKNIASLQHELAANNTSEIHRLAHSLKSTSANVGAEQLSAAAKTFELEAKNGNLDNAAAHISNLQTLFAAVKQEIR